MIDYMCMFSHVTVICSHYVNSTEVYMHYSVPLLNSYYNYIQYICHRMKVNDCSILTAYKQAFLYMTMIKEMKTNYVSTICKTFFLY